MKKYKGGKIDWVGKKLTSQFFPQGKNGPARFFPGEKTDWGEIPACYTRTGSYPAPSPDPTTHKKKKIGCVSKKTMLTLRQI